MKRILKQPETTIYKNVERIENILEEYIQTTGLTSTAIAIDILDEFKIPWGKKTKIELLENNVQAVLEDGKITVEPVKGDR